MPWKGEKDPYKIWLSEIILQQTRVEQGWAYYEKFIKAFPTVQQLARAPRKKIFKLWEGLGYYNRCKNLIETAKKISKDYKGIFPGTYEEIKSLKGIGPYTASAIASFAFNLPYAVVDGNVERVLSRYFGINTPVDTAYGKKMYRELANGLLDKKQAGIYNQAIMDFGALVCKPQNPICPQCPQRAECQAFQYNMVDQLPLKAKRIEKKNRWFYYFIIQVDGYFYVRQRKEKDIWQNLYEFVLHETSSPLYQDMLSTEFVEREFGNEKITVISMSEIFKQQLTHQTIHAQFVRLSAARPAKGLKGYTLIKQKDINKLPFPRTIRTYIDQALVV